MKIKETLRKIVDKNKEEIAKSGGGPAADSKVTAEAVIEVRGPDGKVKSTHKANKTKITL